MMSQKPPTREEYEAAMAQQARDVTAPPTAGGLFPTAGFGGSSGSVSPSETAPPADPYSGSDSTTFSSGYSNTVSDEKNSSSGSWFSFGGGSS